MPDAAPRSSAFADLVVRNANVYTMSWGEPARDGTRAPDAPRGTEGWRGDATALAIRDGLIVAVGSDADVATVTGPDTVVVELPGATVLPGLIDTHTHIFSLGAALSRISLHDAETEEEAVALIEEAARTVPAGEWIIGHGWDEGAWANRYPDMRLLTERVPNHPVYMRSLHSFAGWGNRLAFERAGITADTEAPVGGEIGRFEDGEPSGLLLNRAVPLLEQAIPRPDAVQLRARALLALERMAQDGYVAIHDAGLDSEEMAVLEALEADGALPIRVYAMLSVRDEPLARAWLERGPDQDLSRFLVTRSVKAYYDGALGSRGARLLEDYSDRPGHRGVSGDQYGFNQALAAELMAAGFQLGIHAIGDAGNRETLDFIESVYRYAPEARANRHRIEHAQVVHPDDVARFAELDVIASMEPPHAVEDKAWAEERLGPVRIRGAYAWRTLREAGARLTFNADNPGSDHDIFYGLHAAITRRDKAREPAGGWYPDQNMTAEEALRGYTTWSAYAGFMEDLTGQLAPGRWADLTIMDIDPLALAEQDPDAILDGNILMTIVAGKVVYPE
ncbi:MAG: amidohydrolase [Pseudomonadales bacterium]|nr:amidohydrolase [Pseudomonadales bacterium]